MFYSTPLQLTQKYMQCSCSPFFFHVVFHNLCILLFLLSISLSILSVKARWELIEIGNPCYGIAMVNYIRFAFCYFGRLQACGSDEHKFYFIFFLLVCNKKNNKTLYFILSSLTKRFNKLQSDIYHGWCSPFFLFWY